MPPHTHTHSPISWEKRETQKLKNEGKKTSLVPEDSSHGCSITERGGSGAGVWKHLSDGQETSFIRRAQTLISSRGYHLFIACDFFLLFFQCCMGVEVLSIFSFSFLLPLSLFRYFRRLLRYSDATTEISHTASISHDRPPVEETKKEYICIRNNKYLPPCQPEQTAFASGCYSGTHVAFSRLCV